MQQQKEPRKAAKPRDTKHLEAWCQHAQRGKWCLYWRGFLMRDRERPPFSEADEKFRLFANAMGNLAWLHYKMGHVILVQERISDGLYQYYAVKK